MSGPVLHSPLSSSIGGLCERTGLSLYRAAGLSRRIFSKRKRYSWAVWGILLQQLLQSPLHSAAPYTWEGVCVGGGHRGQIPRTGEEYAPWRASRHTFEASVTVPHHRRPHAPIHSPEVGECLNLWVPGFLESWAGGCLSPGGEWTRAGLGPRSWLQPKRPAKLAWPV